MMKKRWFRWGVVPAVIVIIYLIHGFLTLGCKLEVRAKAAVLLDSGTGKALMDMNGEQPLPSANMAKLMTELLVLEDVAAGRASWSDKVKISRYASTVGGVNLALRHGESMTCSELFQSMVIYSANDAAVALAEHLSGSEAAFVQRMNAEARKIKLSSDTYFTNASGAGQQELGPNHPAHVEGDTRMTAVDTAKLASYLITTHPEILSTSRLTQVELKGKDMYLSNTNWMLSSLAGPYSYMGTDGLKTGYTADVGYCFTGTAEKNGKRLIAVVMGASSRAERFEETRKLFDYGFNSRPALKDRLLSWINFLYG